MKISMDKNICRLCIPFALVVLFGCTRDIDTAELASYPASADVFIDKFSSDLNFSAWGKVTNLDVDFDTKYSGTASLRVSVPEPDDPMGNWAGGNFYSTVGRDLSSYDALTFYVKSSLPAVITVGLGDSDESKYRITLDEVKVNSNWRKVIIPIPNPSKLVSETGLFYYSAGAVDGNGFTIWFDDVKFEKLGTLAHARIEYMDFAGFPGELEIGTLTETVNLPDGTNQKMQVSPHYFTYVSSDVSVASVSGGMISVYKKGSAMISVKEAEGEFRVTGVDFAPEPQFDEKDVISLFSDKYVSRITANWNPRWEYSTAEFNEISTGGNKVAHYTNLNFVGIVFDSQVDCRDKNFLHLDVMTLENIGADSELKIEVHNMPQGSPSSVVSYTVKQSSHDNLLAGEWLSLDIPLDGLASRENIAQIVLSSLNLSDIYVDNVFFYSGESIEGDRPLCASPEPKHPDSAVISLYSDAYDNVPVATWSADWDMADVFDDVIDENNAKRYSIEAYAGIDFSASVIDLSGMSNIHLDLWVPADHVGLLNLKLVDFGDDGVYGGGDDVEHELSLPELIPGEWNSIDLPLSDFTGLITRKHLAQILIIGNAEILYLDNLYFYSE